MGMDTIYLLKTVPFIITGFMFGTIAGSSLTCFLMRRVAGESWVKGRSHCDACGKELHWYELIPILSYLALRGRCSLCHAKIPPYVLLTELALGGIGGLAGFAFLPGTPAIDRVLTLLTALVLALCVVYILQKRVDKGKRNCTGSANIGKSTSKKDR